LYVFVHHLKYIWYMRALTQAHTQSSYHGKQEIVTR